MKAVILAGGFGTRPLKKLDPNRYRDRGRPIIFHIMEYLAFYGIKDFIICCGYKGYVIKEYF